MSAAPREVVVVGGGIAGLYCSYHLARSGWRVRLYEATERLGGRIYTWDIDKTHQLWAELGPMRFEPDLQKRVGRLLKELGSSDHADDEQNATDGDLIRFPDYRSVGDRAPLYNLCGAEEKRQKTLLDLFKLGLRRICPRLKAVAWSATAHKRFEEMLASSRAGGSSTKKSFDAWLRSLDADDYSQLREKATFDGVELWRMGLWNLLSEVLDHMAVIKIRDWGAFFHILPENPNAADWLIVWLKSLSFGAKLRTVKGGMQQIVTRLVARLRQEQVVMETGKKLVRVRPIDEGQVELCFEDKATGAQITVKTPRLILALPKRPLEHLSQWLAPVKEDLDSVIAFPLIKCFFLCDVVWWEGRRKPNEYAEVAPTRELWYWIDKDRSTSLTMVYTDRPGTEFWANYLPAEATECKLEKWDRTNPNHRLEKKFEQYLKVNGVRSFSTRNLIEYGMIDWSREPYGAGCHVWRPGKKSWEVRQKLKAFALPGSSVPNVHICGEAFSDYQGFIEGALSSADDVLQTLGIDPAPS